MATTTASSFGRERNRAATVLRAAAQDNAHWADQTMPSALAVLQSVTTQAGITGFNPVECAGVFSGLASVTGQGHLHLLRSDGSQVCSLRAPDVPDREIPGGSWFNSVRESHEPVNGGTAVDPLTGHA
ncbi:MAG TPA: hypothetical protein VHL53_05825, partial [Acidimicrobiia bacterium]|nr:hypothetical protein [Acidimicrobiia bacterium]